MSTEGRNAPEGATEDEERAGNAQRSKAFGVPFDSERAREAGILSGQARRKKAEDAARAPRQVIATTLAQEHELLAQATRRMLVEAVAGDTKAFSALLRAFPEGFGRVGEAGAPQDDAEDAPLTLEQIRLLGAALDAVEGKESEGDVPQR